MGGTNWSHLRVAGTFVLLPFALSAFFASVAGFYDAPIEALADIAASQLGSMALSWVHFEDFPIRERARAAARVLAESLKPAAT